MQLFFASVSHCVTLFNTGWVNKYLTMIMFGTSSTESWSYWIPSNGHSVETQDHCVIITYLSSMTIYHPITFYSLGAHLMLLKLSPLGCRTGNTHCSRACAFTDTAVLSPSNWINGCSLPPQAILTVHIESNFVFPSLWLCECTPLSEAKTISTDDISYKGFFPQMKIFREVDCNCALQINKYGCNQLLLA